MDAAGKDGVIAHVMSGVNPQGCQVFSYKHPSAEELRHDFLWRTTRDLPERGRIGIFNRSYYEEVLIVRVHPEILRSEGVPGRLGDERRVWRDRYRSITELERHLSLNGTRIVKFFLHVSEAEQRRRLLERLDDPEKQWKFSPADLAEHGRFEEYQAAYEDAITATSTRWAPWYVVPADHKYALRALVGGIVVDAIDALDLSRPELDDAQRQVIARAAEVLRAEDRGG